MSQSSRDPGRLTFYILAGGQSSRMGQNKALMNVGGVTLIERVISAIPAENAGVKIVTNNAADYAFLTLDCIPDIYPGLGPISGVHAGLSNSDTAFSFFLACDLPFITGDVISRVLESHKEQDFWGARTSSGIEPLCAIYSRTCVPVIEKLIERKEYSLQNMIALVNSDSIPVEDDCLTNLNSPEDWPSFLRRT